MGNVGAITEGTTLLVIIQVSSGLSIYQVLQIQVL